MANVLQGPSEFARRGATQIDCELDAGDELNCCRGILFGFALSIPLYAAIFWIVWTMR